MITLLSTIPIDIVEIIIIVSSRDYVFEELQKVLFKLRQPNRISRINDKFTKFYNKFECVYEYYLNNKIHREYDKPAKIWNGGSMQYYLKNDRNRKNDYPTGLDSDCSRYWSKNEKEHRDNDFPREISSDGSQEWMINGHYFRENNKPFQIKIDGVRYHMSNGYNMKRNFVFDYLNN